MPIDLQTHAPGSLPLGWALSLLTCAGLAGAAGVALAAIAAHAVQTPGLASAAQMLLLHAVAAVAVVSLAARCERPRRLLAVATVLLGGALLFSGDVSLLNLAGRRVFPYAAPIGGSTMIAGWLGLTVVSLLELLKKRGP